MNSLLKDRDFRLIVVAVGLSSLGDVLAAVALTIRVHDLTGSGLAVAFSRQFSAMPCRTNGDYPE